MSNLPDLLGAEFMQPTETRIQKGLTNPGSPGSMQLGAINKITQARLRWAMAELTALNLEKVSGWLDALAADSPAKALEMMMELIKFTTPQQKSMTVETGTQNQDNLPQMSLAQLQGLVFRNATENAPVSEQ